MVHTNNEMAGSIMALFQSLVAEILPKYAFEAQLQGTDAHEGLQLKYAQSGEQPTTARSYNTSAHKQQGQLVLLGRTLSLRGRTRTQLHTTWHG